MIRIFLGSLLFLMVGACAGPSVAGEKKAECYVRYLAPEAQYFAEVRLLEEVAGQSGMQAIESPSGVRYQGILMGTLQANGLMYRLEQAGGYSTTHRFDWQDAAEKKYSFEITLPAITNFSFGSKSLSRKNPATLRWDGAPLEQQESLILMWETTDRQFTIPMEISGTPGQDHIEFPAAELAKLPTGTWSLYLVRKKRVKDDQNGTTVLGVAEYYTQSDTLQVLD